MQDNKLPKIMSAHHKKASIQSSKKHAIKGFIIHQKYDCFHSCIPQNNLTQIQQVIDLKPNNLNIISRKRSLSEFINNKKVNLAHIQQFNKKIFILNQKPVQELQTFKSLMNIKSPTKRIILNSKIYNRNIYNDLNTQPLWNLNKSQALECANQMSLDFEVRPWNQENCEKQNMQPSSCGFTLK